MKTSQLIVKKPACYPVLDLILKFATLNAVCNGINHYEKIPDITLLLL
jgi:hypothetical protein